MTYNQIVRMQKMTTKRVRGYRHPPSRPRKALKVSARQHAAQLIEEGRVTTRDLELIRALIGVGMLTRQQIQRLFFNNHAKMAANRLARLYQYHFLDRSSYWLEDMGQEGFEPCYIYTIGAVGLETFALRMGVKRGDVPYTPGRYTLTREDHFLLHDLQISEMFTRMRVDTVGYELVWFNEMAAILRQGEDEVVRPDGTAVLMGGKEEAAFFIEMDRGNTEWGKKVAAYERARVQLPWRQTLRVDGWQPTRYPGVLCVVPAALESAVRAHIMERQPETRFYVKSWERFLLTDIFTGWYQVGVGPVATALLEG